MNASPDLPGPVRKFNPGTLQSDKEVKRQFVVRQPKLDIVLEVLRGNVDSPSCQHILIVAPRGRGKTMLLARTAAELRTDGALSERLLPVQFMEESQEVFTLSDFWLEALFHLARESRQCDPELARELQDAHTELAAGWRGEGLEARARATVLEAADRLDRKLVLMVENLQALCESVDDDFGWKLRGVLQSEPQIILLATATSRFRRLDDAREPFFELFRILRLEPLDTGECRRLWRTVSGDEVGGREIRPLEILTGGNPRLLVIVAEFARHRSLRQLMEELVTLIDDHTEYFRAHLAGLAKTERRVYLAVIDLWQASSTGEVAARARMDVRPVSTLLGRLVDRGAVVVEGSGRKRRYAAAERLYSIYYKLRRERDEAAVVRNLIHFMAVFYTEGELAEMSGRLKAEAAQWPALREGILRAFTEAPEVRRAFSGVTWGVMEGPSDRAGAVDDKEAERLLGDVKAAVDEGAFEEVIETADRWLAGENEDASRAHESHELVVARMLNAKGFACAHLGQPEAAVAAWEQVIERFGASHAPEVRHAVAMAWANKGTLHGQLGEPEAAVAACDKMLEHFGASDRPEIQAPVAMALVSKGTALGQIGNTDAAMVMFDEVVERFGASGVPEAQAAVAGALVGKGHVLERSGNAEAALAVFGEVVTRFGDKDVPEIRALVATALVDQGAALDQLGEAGAVAAFDEVIERFGTDDAPEIQADVARALLHKVVAQGPLGDAEATIAACDALIERFDESDAPEIQLPVAMAWTNKAFALGQLGNAQAAIAICDEVVRRFGDSDAPEVRLPIAMALNCKASLYGLLGAATEAIAALDEVIERFGDIDAPELQEQIAVASFNRRLAQGQPGKPEEVMAIYDRAGEYLRAGDAAQLRLLIAMLLAGTGIMQELSGEPEAAIATCDEAIERFGDTDVPELRLAIVALLAHKAKMQAWIGHAEEALRTCDELERRLGSLADDEKAEPQWLAEWVRTKALLRLQRHTDATATFRSVYAAFVPGDETMMRRMVEGVIGLITAGAPERALLKVLSSNPEKAAGLAPLVVALRQRAGEAVRAPPEVLEVASDIHKRIEEDAGSGGDAPRDAAPS